MPDYNAIQAKVTSVFSRADIGKPVTLTSQTQQTNPATGEVEVIAGFTVTGSAIEVGAVTSVRDNSPIQMGDIELIMNVDPDQSEPETGMKANVGGMDYTLVWIKPIAPGTVTLMREIFVRK